MKSRNFTVLSPSAVLRRTTELASSSRKVADATVLLLFDRRRPGKQSVLIDGQVEPLNRSYGKRSRFYRLATFVVAHCILFINLR